MLGSNRDQVFIPGSPHPNNHNPLVTPAIFQTTFHSREIHAKMPSSLICSRYLNCQCLFTEVFCRSTWADNTSSPRTFTDSGAVMERFLRWNAHGTTTITESSICCIRKPVGRFNRRGEKGYARTTLRHNKEGSREPTASLPILVLIQGFELEKERQSKNQIFFIIDNRRERVSALISYSSLLVGTSKTQHPKSSPFHIYPTLLSFLHTVEHKKIPIINRTPSK